MIEHPTTPVGLDVCIRSTADISLTLLRKTFEQEIATAEAEVDECQFFFKSLDGPSFVQIVATWPWWTQLAVGAASLAAQGYLSEAGASLWKNQNRIFESLTQRLWSVADRIVTLNSLLEPKTKILLAIPSSNDLFPFQLEIKDFSRNAVAIQIAALCYHAPTIENFVESEAFKPAMAGWITIEEDGSVTLHWQDIKTLASRSQLFPV